MLQKEKTISKLSLQKHIDFFGEHKQQFKSKKLFNGFFKSFFYLIIVELFLVIFSFFIIFKFCITTSTIEKINTPSSFSYHNSISSSDIQLIHHYLKK